MNYRLINNICGWISFVIATYVYLSTIEPTASFWDCGEFIATAYKLEVGHPPGAPFFMLVARFFSMWVSPENAAMMVNALSGLCSSFTILFLFWTVTYFGKKIALSSNDVLGKGSVIAIMASGFVGALGYAFTDSFWFSAVEGEVYAMSSLFTAVVFWAMLKWEEVADQPHANRWIILIAYLMGLSIGVHLLNLLAIPAMCFVYYFKKFKVTTKGLLKAAVVSIVILFIVQYGIIPGTVSLASKFELAFVNGMGLPFNSGVVFYLLLLTGLIVWGLNYTRKKGKVLVHTALLAVTVILIGYSSFAMIYIRSMANPPMDENNPENVFTLLSYLKREQYGDRPLFHGQYFNSPLDNQEPYVDGDPVYFQDKEKGKYVVTDNREKSIPNYASEFKSLFPRMYSSDKRHIRAYKEWSDFEGKPIRYRTIQGENKVINKPTRIEDLRYFFGYQLGWMYARYFMWNFAGRQNDVQGHGGKLDGNWLSGINFIDNKRLGNQENLPESLASNPARNKYYLLPLILGLIGLLFQFNKTNRQGVVVLLLFFFTGIAIVIYLNQYPYQPRERDYAYAASFYAFAIWIGLGVLALYEALKKKLPSMPSAILAGALCMVVPGILAAENWDDHDRSNTYTARDFAKAYLDSCAPNAILFTNGDNDTFPLWYVQEVEEYRTDVRVINLSLLNTDWYIDQMRRKAYDSEPVPFGLKPEQYRQGTRDYLPIVQRTKEDVYADLKKVMDFVANDKEKRQFGNGKMMSYLPTKKFSLKVDSAQVVANGTVSTEMASNVVDEIKWELNKSYILKNDMMILDLLANNNWERPVYFAITTGNDSYIGLEDYFQLEGLAYRLVPVKANNNDGQTGRVYAEKMYNNLMNKFDWGGIDKHNIYLNENNRRMCMNLRNNFYRLAKTLIQQGQNDKAIEVLDKCMKVLPEKNVPYNFFLVPIAETYYALGEIDKANKISERLFEIYSSEVEYYCSLDDEYYSSASSTTQRSISVLYRLSALTQQYKQDELSEKIKAKFEELQQVFNMKEQNQKLRGGQS